MKDFTRKTIDGVLAGIMIIIGCTVYLSCLEVNKILGALMFAVALITICYKGFSLYTGKIGFMTIKNFRKEFPTLSLGLFGNVLATLIFGLMINYALPQIKEKALAIVSDKLNQDFFEAFIKAIFCGILMYVAVALYKEKNTMLGVVFCIPTFILCGFEHSIANMGYFAIAGVIDFNSFLYIWTVILGNTVGGLLFPLLKSVFKEKENG